MLRTKMPNDIRQNKTKFGGLTIKQLLTVSCLVALDIIALPFLQSLKLSAETLCFVILFIDLLVGGIILAEVNGRPAYLFMKDYMKYNLSDRMLFLNNYEVLNGKEKVDLDWIKKNTVVVHYCGKNKPWNDNYKGILDCFYNKIENTIKCS